MHEKTKYSNSGRGITTELGGGGTVYGKSQIKTESKISGGHAKHGAGSGVSHAPSVGVVSATGASVGQGSAARSRCQDTVKARSKRIAPITKCLVNGAFFWLKLSHERRLDFAVARRF